MHYWHPPPPQNGLEGIRAGPKNMDFPYSYDSFIFKHMLHKSQDTSFLQRCQVLLIFKNEPKTPVKKNYTGTKHINNQPSAIQCL
jgi:hypothetical protein